jgi:hypothetical protein
LLAEYYAIHHPDDPHARDTQARLLVCCDYFLEHLQEFVVEHMARPTDVGCWVSPHLDAALYRLFAGVQIEKLHSTIPVSIVLGLAEEQQQLHPDV